MRFTALALLLLVSSFMATSQTKIYLTVGGESRSATLADNSATKALVGLLEKGAFSVRMTDYGGFEKVGQLPQSLPTSNSQITTGPGDIMLYQGNQMVIFYGTNSWAYTPLGKIDNATAADVKDFLGSGPVEVTVSLTPAAGIADAEAVKDPDNAVYDLSGRRTTRHNGIHIKKGKILIR